MGQFRRVVYQHKQRIYGFALYYSGNLEDGEEITQDVLRSLWRHLHTAQPDKLPAWVIRVTRNACIDAIGKRQDYRAHVIPENQDKRKTGSTTTRGIINAHGDVQCRRLLRCRLHLVLSSTSDHNSGADGHWRYSDKIGHPIQRRRRC